MKTTSRKDKSKENMGTPKTPNHHRSRGAQYQKKKNENKKSIEINGDKEKPEQLIVHSSSSRPQGGEEKSSKSGSSKRQDVSNGDRSSCSKKQRTKKEEEEEEEEESKLNVIPMNRVQRIVKSEGPDLKINLEAYFLINKATVIQLPNLFFF